MSLTLPEVGYGTHLSPKDADTFAQSLCKSYQELCKRFLPVSFKDSKWRYSRQQEPCAPEQGWKLHVSATVLTANGVLEKVAPFLIDRGILFKAPFSLEELGLINSGIYYGYCQVGKFITVYPRGDEEAVSVARCLHKLTLGMTAPQIPFDKEFRPGSCVYYRYGAFSLLEMENPDGTHVSAIRDPEGNLVPDLRESAGPAWAADPFIAKRCELAKTVDSPLKTTFLAFRALSQRGKGGVYKALDLSVTPPRFCILKEGRTGGEIVWDGRDGYWRIRNEERIIRQLEMAGVAVPRFYSSFEVEGQYYLVIEFIEGHSLHALLSKRRRRLSISKALGIGIQLSLLISQLHEAGWVWRDCKPTNLIVTKKGELRPVDFEGACPLDLPDPFGWNTPEFSPPECHGEYLGKSRAPEDFYAIGVTLYFLLTGIMPDSASAVPLRKLRRGVPQAACDVISDLLSPDPQQRPDGRTVARRLGTALT